MQINRSQIAYHSYMELSGEGKRLAAQVALSSYGTIGQAAAALRCHQDDLREVLEQEPIRALPGLAVITFTQERLAGTWKQICREIDFDIFAAVRHLGSIRNVARFYDIHERAIRRSQDYCGRRLFENFEKARVRTPGTAVTGQSISRSF